MKSDAEKSQADVEKLLRESLDREAFALGDLETLRKRHDEALRALVDKDAEIAQLEGLRGRLQQSESDGVALQERLHEASTAVSTLREQLQRRDEEVSALRARLAEVEDSLRRAEDMAKVGVARVAELEELAKAAESARESAVRGLEVERAAAAASALAASEALQDGPALADARREVEGLQHEVARLRGENEELAGRLAQRKEEKPAERSEEHRHVPATEERPAKEKEKEAPVPTRLPAGEAPALPARLHALQREEEDWETRSNASARSGDSEFSSAGGETCGVGLRITDAAPYRVRGCLAGGAAHKTGEIRPGDVLLSVDGVQVGGLPIGEVRSLIVGRAGSTVEMQLQRSRGDERRVFPVRMVRGAPGAASGPPAIPPGLPRPPATAVGREALDAAARRREEEDEWETRSAYSAMSGESALSSAAGGDVCGVGLRITDAAPYRVRGCLAGGPAHRTGEIRPGDVLLSVDGAEVAGRSIAEVRRLIVGRAGSRVEMRFQRSRGDERRLLVVSMIRSPAAPAPTD